MLISRGNLPRDPRHQASTEYFMALNPSKVSNSKKVKISAKFCRRIQICLVTLEYGNISNPFITVGKINGKRVRKY